MITNNNTDEEAP